MERWNPWWRGEQDPTYQAWLQLPIKWLPKEMQQVSLKPYSLNFISGPRQVGKTTMLKLLIARLLEKTDPRAILYLSCDELSHYTELGEVLDSYIRARRSWGIGGSYIFLDEITFVEDWWRALKARIDDGSLSSDVVFVTGSASLDLLRQKEQFPGRRGYGVDVVMRPLGFRSYVMVRTGLELAEADRISDIGQPMEANRVFRETLAAHFSDYLETGGFPLAIREWAEQGRVSEATKRALRDGLRSDWLRAGKSERYMKEVIAYILQARGTPVSWLGISKATSLGSPHTARGYVETLEDLMVAQTLNHVGPDGRALHRKNKKIHFTDPLIYRVFSEFTNTELDEAAVVEGVVAAHLARKYETYYWRNKTEVDIILFENKGLHGIEVKWGFRTSIKPRFLRNYLSLDRETIPTFLASLSFT
jgi:predicted AAA+ superfamily ATPase